jgi:hypothetical protein
MNWRLLTRKDVLGAALAAVLVGVVLFLYIAYPSLVGPTRLNGNFGFGAEWSCSYPGKGDPVCVKKQQ